MSILSLRLPDSLHKNIKKLSEKERISINQFITNAVTEKMTALETESYLQERAKKGNINKYLDVLKKVKNDKINDAANFYGQQQATMLLLSCKHRAFFVSEALDAIQKTIFLYTLKG